jgi:hypothetical protein
MLLSLNVAQNHFEFHQRVIHLAPDAMPTRAQALLWYEIDLSCKQNWTCLVAGRFSDSRRNTQC